MTDHILAPPEFRPVPGLEDAFSVSAEGEVISVLTGKLLKPYCSGNGYLRVAAPISVIGRRRQFGVHRLVALAWVPNPNGKPYVNHLDFDGTNNSATNLEWATQKDNMTHSAKAGRIRVHRGQSNVNAKLTDEAVRFILRHHMPGDYEFGARGLGRRFGVAGNTIRRVITGAGWAHVTKRANAANGSHVQ